MLYKFFKTNPFFSSLLLVIVAYIFAVITRLMVYYAVSSDSSLFFHGEIIPLWTPDAGLYGFYAKNILSGVASYPLVSEYIPAYLLVYIVKLTGISIDSAIYFAPAFVSSSVVIPMILIAKHYDRVSVGFFASISAILMPSFFYRSFAGYYDTDILNVTFVLFIVYFLIKYIDSNKLLYALQASLSILLFRFWYHSSLAIILSMVLIYIVYVLIFDRKETKHYLVSVMLLIPLLPVAFVSHIVMIGIWFVICVILQKQRIPYYYYLLAILVSMVAMGVFVDLTPYYARMLDYVHKAQDITIKGYHFKADLDTVGEAQKLSWIELVYQETFIWPFFIIGSIGYIWAMIKNRSLLMSLPLALLVLLSMVAGIRFSMYGVFVIWYGLFYALYEVSSIWIKKLQIRYIVYAIISVFVVALNLRFIIHDHTHVSPSYFETQDDLRVLEELKQSAKRGDYVLTWWDFGWPLWYYTGLDTIIDNGKHQQDNYLVSKLLLSYDQKYVYELSKFTVQSYINAKKAHIHRVVDYLIKHKRFDDIEHISNTKYTYKHDIYILLHYHMLDILYNLEAFSNIDTKTYKQLKSNILSIDRVKHEDDIHIDGNSEHINLQKGISHAKVGDLQLSSVTIIKDSKVVFYKRYPYRRYMPSAIIYNNKILIVKPKLYYSFLIQGLLYEHYSKNLFKKVAKSKNMLILKLKI